MAVTITGLSGVPLVRAGDDLAGLAVAALAGNGLAAEDGDILVVAQKIVSKAEGRVVDLAGVTPGAKARALAAELDKDARLVELILSESRRVVRQRAGPPGLLIMEHRLGFVMANAGVDHSNVAGEEDRVLLLPVDPDASARALREALYQRLGKRIAVIVNDSFGRPWRKGVTGVALGAAGLPALVDKRGDPDLFGRPLLVTEIGFADEIATAASLVMGQADEGVPMALLRGLSWSAPDSPAAALLRPPEHDLFR